MKKTNLLGMDQTRLAEFLTEMGEKSFRATQVFKWIHQNAILNFDEMSNISKSLRQRLQDFCEIKLPEVIFSTQANDGTHKWLLRVDGNNAIETVYIPEKNRGTLCVSTQVGCALDCRFCSTARQGFNRNLSSSEIIAQVWIANKYLQNTVRGKRKITNVVFMGMGEPLLNLDAVISSIRILLDDNAYGLSKRRVTVSTSGIVPALTKLRQYCDVSLAISLHAPDNALRDTLVPINKKYPIEQLMQACRDYFQGDTRLKQFTIEYVMLDRINDSPQQAYALVNLLKGIPCKINLIPFNPFPQTEYRCSSPARIAAFQKILMQAGLFVFTRKTRGEDIDAACGQLAGQVNDRSRRAQRLGKMPLPGNKQLIPVETYV